MSPQERFVDQAYWQSARMKSRDARFGDGKDCYETVTLTGGDVQMGEIEMPI
jgi:hypothetical protein